MCLPDRTRGHVSCLSSLLPIRLGFNTKSTKKNYEEYVHPEQRDSFHHTACDLVSAGGHALLVVARGLVVGVDDGVRSHSVGVVRLGPLVDGVDVGDDGALGSGVSKEGEHCLHACSKPWSDL
jgi:hypothetical protein